MSDQKQKQGVSVEGIVARRNKEPYVLLFHGDKQIAQLSVGEARNFARDIECMCSRTEADAMIHKFFDRQEYPQGAAEALMMEFRNFRFELDQQPIGRFTDVPSTDAVDFTKKKTQ